MSGDTRAIRGMEESRAICMSFACPAMSAGAATPTKSCRIAKTSVVTLVSFFVLVLLAFLPLLVLVCLTGLVKLNGLVGLMTLRVAGQGV
jgi:hypothetical protein